MPVTSEKLEVTFRSISQLDASLCWVRPPPCPFVFFCGGGGEKIDADKMFKVSIIKTVERKIRP